MSYLKPELNKPVRVKWNGEFPNFDTAKQYPRHAYNVEVDGKPMVFEATESTHEKIQQFSKMNGNEFVIVKRPNPRYPNGTIYNIEPFDITNSPQNAPMYNQSHSEYKKSQPAPQTPQETPDEPAFLGMCANQAALLLAHGKIGEEGLEKAANMFYGTWKNWTPKIETGEKTQVTRSVVSVSGEKPKEEAPPVGDTDFIGDVDLPF